MSLAYLSWAAVGNPTLATKLCVLYPSINFSFICHFGGNHNMMFFKATAWSVPGIRQVGYLGHKGFYWYMMITILENTTLRSLRYTHGFTEYASSVTCFDVTTLSGSVELCWLTTGGAPEARAIIEHKL